MTPLAIPLTAFLERLQAACSPLQPAAVEDVLGRYSPDAASLAPFLGFGSDRYRRQRLHREDAFELLLLSWDRGQSTPVHDHDEQAGWFSVLEGSLSVQEYERAGGPSRLRDLAADDETEPGTCALRPGGRYVVDAGDTVAEADAPETIHRVGARGGRAVSLHLYAGPLDRILLFDEVRGTAKRVTL